MCNRCNKNITYQERLKIEVLHQQGYSAWRIAEALGRGERTIYRELKRGPYQRLLASWDWTTAYSADIAQRSADRCTARKGAPLKIGHDHEFASYISSRLRSGLSPAAALGEMRRKGLSFNTTISVPTLYRYLDSGVLSVGNESLISGKRPRRCRKAKPHNIQNPLAKSITQRPEYVNLRDEVGHWEMDTVVGEKKAGQSCLLVLTERMSRKEIIIKMAGKTAACTVRALDILQRRYGADFPRIFKTITVDNGCEFADVKGIEKDGRTQLYFCHPYSSWERGSNENLNKMIRRFVPKGFSINKVSRKQVHRIQTFMNSYPRKILGWRCADDVFYEAFLKEGINLTGYQKQ